ncbi:unnamed protein product [Sordaria macrospora k-hell]|uniref:WGS project CABT00000000 data, contig 2.4 n=1 Tax=Sordaria macrospora (strain ATCC MYA-333 / DSM 997 / K(L3346) / K-hell) TaxID=771870 RepID=F7VQW6_SORMK|nr:uncharacterized protein SMAC_01463 [Sordaria macrospora k-hell]CCC07899.1 unnamed protein product [Sordaria macrospora k-hell]
MLWSISGTASNGHHDVAMRQLSIDDYQVYESPSSESEGENSFRYHPSFAYEPGYTEEPQSSLDEPTPLQNHPQQQQQQLSSKDNEQEKIQAADDDDESKKYPWMSGGLRRFPYSALLPLVLSVACTGAAIYIVLSSDGQPVDGQWSGKMQPGVLLAYTSTFANTFLGVAFAEASVICFWSRAVKNEGMPITNLHYYWAGSTGVVGAVKALSGKRAVRVSLVCLLVAITSLLRGPLMQRASSVQTVSVLDTGKIDLAIMPNVSSDWAGYVTDTSLSGYGGVDFSAGFASVAREYQAKTPMRIPDVAECDNCSISVPAFGFNVVNCSTSYIPYNLTLQYNKNGTTVLNKNVTAIIFKTYISFDAFQYGPEPEDFQNGISVQVTHKNSSSCRFVGKTISHKCLLTPVSMKYNIFLDRGNVSFQSGTSWRDDELVDRFFWPLAMPSHSTLLPLHSLGQLLFESSTTVIYDGLLLFPQNMGIMPVLYKKDSSKDPEEEKDLTGMLGGYSGCTSSFSDPMDDIINSFREIAFRMSIRAAAEHNSLPEVKNGTKTAVMQRNVTYTSARQAAQYAADRSKLGVGVVVSLLGPVATLGLFWGWWRLGREFSLSPLEVVGAFVASCERRVGGDRNEKKKGGYGEYGSGSEGSETRVSAEKDGRRVGQQQLMTDIFNGCSSNASAGQLAKHIRRGDIKGTGDTRDTEPMIQYGVVDGRGRLGFAILDPATADREIVRQPRRGELL